MSFEIGEKVMIPLSGSEMHDYYKPGDTGVIDRIDNSDDTARVVFDRSGKKAWTNLSNIESVEVSLPEIPVECRIEDGIEDLDVLVKAAESLKCTMTRAEYLAAFEEITTDMLETTRKKNQDYSAGADNAFGNFMMVEHLGISSAEVGMLTRMTDKMSRIASFLKNGELLVKDESVYDTLKDLSVYSIIMAIYLKNKKVSGN